MIRLIFELINPNYMCVDLIKSKIYPNRDLILSWLDDFEQEEFGNYYLSDTVEEYENDLVKLYKKQLNFSGQLRLISYDDHNMDLQEYRNTLDWAVVDLLYWTNFSPILASEVPLIREFLNTPVGQEKEALKRWQDYWKPIEDQDRIDIALM